MQKEEFNNIKKSIGKVQPNELGKMFREYHKKYVKGYTNTPSRYEEASRIFDGGLFNNS